jgi:molecular chaperone GrpE
MKDKKKKKGKQPLGEKEGLKTKGQVAEKVAEKDIDQTIDQNISDAVRSIEAAEREVEKYHEEICAEADEAEPKRDYHDLFRETEAKLNETFDRLLRTKADFDNYRKRVAKEKVQLIQSANEDLIAQLLPIIDNFERAVSHASTNEAESKGFIEGVEMILKQLLSCLEGQGLKAMSTVGEKFDPNYHEAIGNEHHDQYPSGTIISEQRKGYMIKDRLLRTPLVVVSKGPQEESEESAKQTETDQTANINNTEQDKNK